MPLITCPACGKEISTAATACPNCGHPIQKPRAARSSRVGVGCLVVVGIIVVLSIIGSVSNNNSGSSKSSGATSSACGSDWSKCSDNEDMANHYSGWTKITVACQTAADNQARYGTPKWPWLPF